MVVTLLSSWWATRRILLINGEKCGELGSEVGLGRGPLDGEGGVCLEGSGLEVTDGGAGHTSWLSGLGSSTHNVHTSSNGSGGGHG